MTTAPQETGQAPTPAKADYWHCPDHHTALPALEPLHDGGYCGNSANPLSCMCTRMPGHPGRHIATGPEQVYAAWPGTHAPTIGDLGHTQDAPEAGPLPALTLPDGWRRLRTAPLCDPCCRADIVDGLSVDATRSEVELLHILDRPMTASEARELAARLTEAAGIVDQLRAGAR